MSLLGKLGLISEAPVEEQTTEQQNPSDEKKEVKQSDFKKGERTVVAKNTTKKPTISFAPTATQTPGQIVGKVDNEIFEKLSVAIEENNLTGNDFLEFMQSLNKLQNVAVDEKSKFNMVYETLKSSSGGMKKDYLLSSIDHYLGVIDNEKKVFEKEMAKATDELVDQKELYIEQLAATAQQKSELIQKLTQEIQEISNEIATVKSESAQAKISIAQKQADFDVTVQQLVGQISDYKTKINQHIQ